MPVGSYIVDYMCVSTRLVIELDGGQHSEQQYYDQKRTQFLETNNLKVIRFWNNEVLENLSGVLETLTLALSQRERELKTKVDNYEH